VTDHQPEAPAPIDLVPGFAIEVQHAAPGSCGWCRDPYCTGDHPADATMTEHRPEAGAVCEHFYASHCYRGMSVRLCMTCHEPDWDDLAGQLADAGRGSELAADPLILSPDEFAAVETVAAVLGLPGSALEPDGPATEATQAPEAIRELEARFREAVAKRGPLTVLPSDRWQERAEAAEAKLAEIAEMCAGDKQVMAIIGADHG